MNRIKTTVLAGILAALLLMTGCAFFAPEEKPVPEEYQQTAVEGSNGKLILCPLANKADSKFIHVSPKVNMLVGYDQMGDTENVMVKEYEPFILSYIATMFFGVQFESIDKRRLKVIELAD